MGNWHISIKGVGSHHNDNDEADADRIAKEAVAKLKAAGHTLDKATFTHGGWEAEELDWELG